jgi:hypothetical protein
VTSPAPGTAITLRPDTRDGPRRAVTQNPAGGRTITTSPPPSCEAAFRVGDGSVNQAVADKLWRLHWDHGYFTRAEIEAALGLDQRESAA